MKWSLVIAVMFAAARVTNAAEPGQLPVVYLEMDNDADVPAATLKKSQDEVVRIFADAGLGVEWTETGPRFTVQMVTTVPLDPSVAPPVLGVVSRTPAGATAHIFFNQVEDLALRYHVAVSRLLAYVVAHEIGHLLLPQMRHSFTGLMKADWDPDTVREAGAGSLRFTGAQIKKLHASADAGVGSDFSSR
jgi:hypothetical protein